VGLKSVSQGIGLKAGSSLDRAVDLIGGHAPLLHQSVKDNRDVFAVKEAEDALEADSEFVNPISKRVRFSSAQLVAKIFKPLQAGQTLD